MKEESKIKVRIRDGKIDSKDLEAGIEKRLRGYQDFKFDYTIGEGTVLVTCRKPETPVGSVEVFLFYFYKLV